MLLNLPEEILIMIAIHLDVHTILRLRRTCRSLSIVSHDRSLWLSLLHLQKYWLNLPLPLSVENMSPSKLGAADIEEAVKQTHEVHQSWLLRRTSKQEIWPKPGNRLMSIQVLLERWLVCIYIEGIISLWDLDPPDVEHSHYWPRPRAKLRLTYKIDVRPEGWTSCVATADADAQSILVSCLSHGTSTDISLYCISLHTYELKTFKLFESVNFTPRIICALCPTLKLIAFSWDLQIHIMNWETKASSIVSAENEEVDQSWHGIVSLWFCPPYILCLRVGAIQLYPIPTSFLNTHRNQSLPKYKHSFPQTTFRDASLSLVTVDESSKSNTVSLLASDIHRGVFHYQIVIPIPSVTDLSDSILEVKPIGKHGMSSTHNPTPDNGSFVTAQTIGNQGKRGVWVRRVKRGFRRDVIAFEALGRSHSVDEISADTHLINERVVYDIGSYDLRDDITHCALSEVTGQIVLGNRAGRVIIL